MFKKDSLYSINKKNPDAVVYKFANGEQSFVTRADFSTEEEFLAFKAWSDEDLHTEDKRDVLAGIRQVSIDDISEAAISVPPADVVMEYQNQRAVQRRKASEMVVQLKDKLTDTQFRRLWMYHVDGKTEEEIAEIEGVADELLNILSSGVGSLTNPLKLSKIFKGEKNKKIFIGDVKTGCKKAPKFMLGEGINKAPSHTEQDGHS